MAVPTLTPVSQTSAIALPATADPDEVKNGILPIGIYSNSVLTSFSSHFCTGASDQVSYTYKKLGGDVLDIELTTGSVFSSYEEAVLEYSYIVNIHQAKNTLSDMLGATTGSFDSKGSLTGSNLSSYTGSNGIALKFPRFEFQYARRVGYGVSTEAGIGGETTIYSASFTGSSGDQDFDLQQIVSASADNGTFGSTNPVGNKRINVTKVYYKSPQAMWRFYGYYGGLNTVGNLSNYGQWTDDSTFDIIPVWQNKAQAMAFEDAIYTRNSHYSYELKNNKLRIFPNMNKVSPSKYWIEFFVETDPWEEASDKTTGTDGINNMNTLPFENIPFDQVNSIGKQWIRRFALALSKETLGNIRSKFTTIPIPGDSVTLDGPALLSQGQTEQEKLREELKTVLDEITYTKLMQADAELTDAVNKVQERVPMRVFMG
tara:strand:+ start:2229 stop:3518 length:1290 start_codon:yes stop_codon:yes gene_type:complete